MDGATQQQSIYRLKQILTRLFPAAASTHVEHAWAGVLGVPRDWSATIGFESSSGLGWAGGYVGTGVATTNVAGRTLADLVTGRSTELTNLPWVGHRVHKWEIEPVRWLAVRGLYGAYNAADRLEATSNRKTTPIIARAANFVSGRS